ncbi:MAG TPA: hypothetical protein VHE35_06060 [Kofleriaceae bacterium]|nr:hypothetical protein [Kofleriaceae bacterium]
MSATSSIACARPARPLGSVRAATPRDARQLERLFHAALLEPPPAFARRGARSQLLVLDLGGRLHAIASVTIDRELGRARVQLLVVDAPHGATAREIEERMLGVGLALCDAYGCSQVELGDHAAGGRPDRFAREEAS